MSLTPSPTSKRPILKCGDDDSFWHWLVPSCTVADLNYGVSIRKDNGNTICECMDAQCRLKAGNATGDVANACKHSRALLAHIKAQEKNL